jgi:hypothetical protein
MKKMKSGGTCACGNGEHSDNGLERQEGSAHVVYISQHINGKKGSQLKGGQGGGNRNSKAYMYLTIQIIGVLQITVIITAQHTLSSGNL